MADEAFRWRWLAATGAPAAIIAVLGLTDHGQARADAGPDTPAPSSGRRFSTTTTAA